MLRRFRIAAFMGTNDRNGTGTPADRNDMADHRDNEQRHADP